MKVLNAQKIGKKIFRISTPFLLEKADIAQNFDQKFFYETLSKYDFINDSITVFSNRIKIICKKHNIDFDSVFLHTFCHELGHSKESLTFEYENIYKYRFNIYGPCHFEIGTQKYNLADFRIGGKKFFSVFTNGINDYAIEKELKKHGIADPLAKLSVLGLESITRDYHESKFTEEQRHRLCVEYLLLLPQHICLYRYGELTEDERKVMEKFYRELIGGKWDFALSTMNDLDLGKPKKYVSITCKLFDNILELYAFLKWEDSDILFNTYKKPPKNWEKDRYQAFWLTQTHSLKGFRSEQDY